MKKETKDDGRFLIGREFNQSKISKNDFLIDGALNFPVRIAKHEFDSETFGRMFYINGSILTPFGIIGVNQSDSKTRLDLVKNGMHYTVSIDGVLDKQNLALEALIFAEKCF
jgi:hypothetical protein